MTAKFFRISLRLLAVWLTISVAGIAQTPPGAATATDVEWHFRYELFQMLLEQNGLEVVSSEDDVRRRPAESVIVSLGNLSSDPRRTIQQFAAHGGAVLLATDQTHYISKVCAFNRGPVRVTRSRDGYQNHKDCIQITDLNRSHAVMKGVNSIVVNQTGWLERPRLAVAWDIAARLPKNSSPNRSAEEPVLASVPMSPSSAGIFLICADPSLFTNGMLWHGDNAILAINISRLFSESGRNKLLFLVDGVPLRSFRESPLMQPPPLPDLPLPDQLPEPELKTMLRVANSVVKNVEESNVLNEILADRPRRLREPYMRRGILFALGLAAMAFLIWKLSASGPPSHPRIPARSMVTAHALNNERRVKSTEFGLSASMLARELCRELTESSDPADWLRQLSRNSVSNKTVVQQRSAQKQLEVVLDLAVNTRTVHISKKRFLFIGQTIQDLRKLHRNQQLLKPESV